MKVQIPIEAFVIELLNFRGVIGPNVDVPYVFANYRSVQPV